MKDMHSIIVPYGFNIGLKRYIAKSIYCPSSSVEERMKERQGVHKRKRVKGEEKGMVKERMEEEFRLTFGM